VKVNQSTGEDLDPLNREAEERGGGGGGGGSGGGEGGTKRKRRGPPPIELTAVLNITCPRCGGKGHLRNECYASLSGQKYELIEEEAPPPFIPDAAAASAAAAAPPRHVPALAPVAASMGRGRAAAMPAWMNPTSETARFAAELGSTTEGPAGRVVVSKKEKKRAKKAAKKEKKRAKKERKRAKKKKKKKKTKSKKKKKRSRSSTSLSSSDDDSSDSSDSDSDSSDDGGGCGDDGCGGCSKDGQFSSVEEARALVATLRAQLKGK
jgi:hypothetical protein